MSNSRTIRKYLRPTRHYSSQSHQTGQDVTMDHKKPGRCGYFQLYFRFTAHDYKPLWWKHLDVRKYALRSERSLSLLFHHRQHISYQRFLFKQTPSMRLSIEKLSGVKKKNVSDDCSDGIV